MFIMVMRLAFRLMWTPDAEHRWRRIVVPVAATILSVLTLTTLSLFQMTRHEDTRFKQRMLPVDRSSTDPTDLWVVSGIDEVDGKQIPVYWVQPVDATARTVLPKGISVLPSPPTAFVSLAADRLLGTELAVHQSLSDRVQIAPEGLRSAGELLMYRPVPATTALSQHPYVMRVHAMDRGQPGVLPMLEIGDRFSVTPENILPASIGLLVIPAVVLMIVAVSAASGVRDHRFGVLRAIGAPRAVLVLLAAFEVLFLWLPGIALGTTIWWFATQLIFTNRQFIPLINHRPITGDLQVPASLLIPIMVVLMLVVAVVAGIGAWVRFGRETTTVRPVLTANTISPWRLAPVGLLAFGIAARIVVGGDGGAFLFLVTTLIVLASLPLVLPQAVRPLGSAIRRIPTIPTLLAGRGIEWDAIRSARPLLSFGVLVAIALAVSGVQAIVHSDDPVQAQATWADTAAVLVNFWSLDKPGDFATMRAALPDNLVVRTSAPDTMVELAATCPQLQPYFPETACDEANPLALPDEIGLRLSQALSHGYAPVTLVEADALETESFLAVIGTGPYEKLIEEVRSAARQHLLWTAITDNDTKLKPPASAVWLVTGLRIAIVVLSIAAIVAAVDRFLGIQKHRAQLLHIGLLPRQLGQIDALQFLVVVLTAITLGAGLGVLTVTQFLANSPETPVPWADMWGVIQLSLLGAVLGTVLVLFFEVRRFSRDDRRA